MEGVCVWTDSGIYTFIYSHVIKSLHGPPHWATTFCTYYMPTHYRIVVAALALISHRHDCAQTYTQQRGRRCCGIVWFFVGARNRNASVQQMTDVVVET